MNGPTAFHDWLEANQRLLGAEFGRLRLRLAGQDEEGARAALGAANAALGQPAAIDRLAGAFGLSAFERDLVLLAAGVEMDPALGALCGEAQGHPQRPWPTFALAAAALANPEWSALAPLRPLRRWRLVELDEASALAAARIRIDERVLHFLAGLDYLDPRLAPLLRPVEAAHALAAGHAALRDALAARLEATPAPLPLVQLNGPDADGREDIAAGCAELLGLRLHALAAADVPAGAAEVAELALLCEREAALGAGALLIDCGSEPAPPQALRLAERTHGVVFLAADKATRPRRPLLACEVGYPAPAERHALWTRALGAAAPEPPALDAIAMQFRLSAHSIAATADALQAQEAALYGAALWRACRQAAPAGLAELARLVEPSAQWDDLVLPPPQKDALAQIVVHMRHRFTVYDRWQFGAREGRGQGISALFTGESGTGKTMAAEVLARELRLDLYRVDLSSVVSKYIGETEKNLRRVFDAAEAGGAMLLFDEADALFGKRSEVKDSHDRYANIEVSYLLQRMEAFTGLAILTSNHKAALDGAFMRRLRFVVHFPFPEAAEREAIWRRVFPAAAPTDRLAFDKLARLQVSGGHIHNIALAAAFLAADAGASVGMAHVLRAARSDAAKRERAIADAEIRGWT
jgi:MoxR-like ATPase